MRARARRQATAAEPVNPLEASDKPEQKTRFSARAKTAKQHKAKGPQGSTPWLRPHRMLPRLPTAQTQAGPLGLAGDTSKKKKKKSTTTGDKTRLSEKKKTDTQPQGDVPMAPAPQTPAPAPQQK